MVEEREWDEITAAEDGVGVAVALVVVAVPLVVVVRRKEKNEGEEKSLGKVRKWE